MKKHVLLSGLAAAAALLASCEKPAPGFTIVGGKNESSGSGATVTPPAANPPKAETPVTPPTPAVITPPVAKVDPPAPPVEPAANPTVAAPMPQKIVPAPANSGATGPSIVIKPEMPKALFIGTPLPSANPPPNLDQNKNPVLEATVPEGVALLSKGKTVTTSDEAPIGDPAVVTDGDKNGEDGYFVDLMPGKQWVQIDLGESKEIWLLWVWHFHKQGVIYNDVVAQVSDDPKFGTATTVYNNDYDNSSGFGVGSDLTYVETNNGRRVSVPGVKGRYVRFWSKGRDQDDTNQYIEIEVYGK